MFTMSREMSKSSVEEKVTDLLALHKQQMLKEMEGMFLKITATSQSKLSSQIASSSLTTVKFRRKSNEEQFKVNADVLSKLEDAEGSLSVDNMEETRQSIISAKSLLQHRQKMIKLADASDLGWKVVSEYETNPLASDSDDEKRMYKAEARANMKARADRTKKVRTSRFNPYRKRASSPQDRRIGGFYPVQPTGTRRIPPGLYFACGKAGHWKGAPECAANISNNKISTYYVNSNISYVSSADTKSDTGE
ncbi:uncharacterized protein LOC132729490 [Ruditapes philippinarum]|uniref:uncharacterized protein LOC132729490 n=1 Tax=Ruditapes philippinarum TaxID=129788 RepID=UPI00295BD64E|nr:uncharacterized protein LOC132729490 [Ruditapes philippinarum]